MWGERRGSNPRHPGPQPGALPAELRPPCVGNSTPINGLLYSLLLGSAQIEISYSYFSAACLFIAY